MRKYALAAALVTLALLLAALSVRLGVADIGAGKIVKIILSELGLIAVEGAGVSPHERAIVWHIRLPRTLTGAFVGASLALSGVMLQGLFRNPMASPAVVGASTGGALGATSAIALGLGAASIWAVPLSAFGGALATVFLVSIVATHKGHTPLGALILCGMAVNSIAGALTTLVLSYSVSDFEIARQILFWLMGSLTNRTWEHVILVAPFFAASAVAAAFFGRELNLMMSGEESAMALGVDTARTKAWILVIAAAAAGASVAVAGVVGFVGLLVPHIVRMLAGPDHRRLLPLSMIAGAVFVMGMDLLARTLSPGGEIRLGVLSAGIGGPFFLYLIVKNRARAEMF